MHGNPWKYAALSLLALGLVDLGGAPTASAGPDRKSDRQIDIFETVLDEMLVDSPNWLVRGHRNARGRYRSGEGVSFSFDVSLVGGDWNDGKWWSGFSRDRSYWFAFDDDDDYDEDREDRRARRKEWREREMSRQERMYKRGKTEIIDTLMDFGDVLTTVPDGEWIEINVDLDRAEFFWEKDLRELTMRVKMADVRAYADEKIDEEALVQRIEVTES